MRHLQRDHVAITGGVAIQLGLTARGRQGRRDHVADLDLVATSIEVIRATVVEHFLVSHYHVVGPGVPKFLIQLVDPLSRIRIDIFPDLAGWIAEARAIPVGEHSIPALPLERIYEHKAQTLSRASESRPIDPKHVDEARDLADALGAASTVSAPCRHGGRRVRR